MKKNKKRECARKHASFNTISIISTEIWLMICNHLQNSPHTVFKLMMTCKSLKHCATKEWWDNFYHKVLLYQLNLKHSNFFYKLKQFHSMEDKKNALYLVFSHNCYFCNTRFGHRLFKPLMVRTCQPCLAKNLVSNVSLELKYGLSFADFLESYNLNKGTIIPFDGFQCNRRKTLKTLSDPDNKYDRNFILSSYHVPRGILFYFFKKHIESFLQVKLEDQEKLQNKRRNAAQYLSVRFRRLATATKITHKCVNIREIASCNERYDKFRKSIHVNSERSWVPGGPMYSCKCQFASKGNSSLHYRPGFNMQVVIDIGKILTKAQAAVWKLGTMDPLPPMPLGKKVDAKFSRTAKILSCLDDLNSI
jgi:hypothetical protein